MLAWNSFANAYFSTTYIKPSKEAQKLEPFPCPKCDQHTVSVVTSEATDTCFFHCCNCGWQSDLEQL
jgi:transcription elongation factor Elf1